MTDRPDDNQTTTRTAADRVRHWWPGYWLGLLEGILIGAAVSGSFVIWLLVR